MPLGQRREAFDHLDWFFELKYDGFRALLSISGGRPQSISRKANALTRFSNLALAIDRELHAHGVLDGEAVLLRRGRQAALPRAHVRARSRERARWRGSPSGPSLDEVGAI
jgi:ATP-dependent DNA ligase